MSSILQDTISADVLFLDDIGAETEKYKTGESVDALCQVLSRREDKWTMITTNIDPMNWSQRFDVRVADRLNRHSAIIAMKCGSYAMK